MSGLDPPYSEYRSFEDEVRALEALYFAQLDSMRRFENDVGVWTQEFDRVMDNERLRGMLAGGYGNNNEPMATTASSPSPAAGVAAGGTGLGVVGSSSSSVGRRTVTSYGQPQTVHQQQPPPQRAGSPAVS